MCRMLESHMDGATKAYMLARINEIESIDADTGQRVGLVYSQRGTKHRGAHFNLTPLISALQRYVEGHNNWRGTQNWAALKASWMDVGLEQRDMPVHVLNEYCHPIRSFYPIPGFNEENLPRSILFCNSTPNLAGEPLFPLVISDSSGLGVNFALTRFCTRGTANGWSVEKIGTSGGSVAELDLAVVSHLDKVRDADLRRSHEILRQADPEPSHGLVAR